MQKNFISRLFIFSAVIAALIAAVQFGQQRFVLNPFTWIAYLYFILLTLVTYFVSRSGLKKDNKTFLTRVYGSIGIRFIFSLAPLLIYLLFSPVKELPFVIAYVLLYFFYTSFEIYVLVVNLRPDLKKTEA